jgi:hypothetical protein
MSCRLPVFEPRGFATIQHIEVFGWCTDKGIATLTWAHDVFGNAVATATFQTRSDNLVIGSVGEIQVHTAAWQFCRDDGRIPRDVGVRTCYIGGALTRSLSGCCPMASKKRKPNEQDCYPASGSSFISVEDEVTRCAFLVS